MRDKKGVGKKFWIPLVIVIIIFSAIYFLGNNCKLSKEESLTVQTSLENNKSLFLQNPLIWVKFHIFTCERETIKLSWVGSSVEWLKEKMGFNEGFGDFFIMLLQGGLIGLFIWLTYLLASVSSKLPWGLGEKVSGSSWLSFIGSSPWKIVPITVFYAVLMLIPILNRFILIISFGVLGLSFPFQAIVLAFYIGMAPALIEGYTKYKLREKYRKVIEVAKANRELQKANVG